MLCPCPDMARKPAPLEHMSASLPCSQQEQFLTGQLLCRAKAGGRQSAKDATGKSIKSAGSALRRHNEVMHSTHHILVGHLLQLSIVRAV